MAYKNQKDQVAAQKRHYEKNRGRLIKEAAARKRISIDWLKEYKSTLACETCGEDHVATLVFHHRDPSQKKIHVSHAPWQGWPVARIKEEIEKCDVLCANCHRKLHWEGKGDAS